MTSINQLVTHYRNWLGFDKFYQIQLNQIPKNPKQFIQSPRYLKGAPYDPAARRIAVIHAKQGDLRIDVPVWFGDPNKCAKRILVFGREPRDSDSLFNVERVGDKVYGATFGADRWNSKSSIKKQPQLKYLNVFDRIISNDNFFILFSDAVKFFHMIYPPNDDRNDKHAESNFKQYFLEQVPHIKQEVDIIQPDIVLALGADSYKACSKHLDLNYNVAHIRHPSNGGTNIAKQQIADLDL